MSGDRGIRIVTFPAVEFGTDHSVTPFFSEYPRTRAKRRIVPYVLMMPTGQFGSPMIFLVLIKCYDPLVHRRRLSAGFHHRIIERAISQQIPDEITSGGSWPKSWARAASTADDKIHS
jgi:hypothetical protein